MITLTAAEMPALPVLYVKRCDDCEVELPEGTSALKIQLQGCKRSVLRVRGKVLYPHPYRYPYPYLYPYPYP